MSGENVRIRLLSGCNVDLSERVHDECYCNFDDTKYFSFSNMINAGMYFPQVVQFIAVIITICKGHTTFKDIFLCNLVYGAGYTILWYLLKMYKLPGLSFISCLIGGSIFRFFLHFVAIAIVSLFVIDEWKVILYCLIGGLVTGMVRSYLFASLSTVSYNDEVAIYVSRFKTLEEIKQSSLQSVPQEHWPKYCSNCGKPVSKLDKYCQHCGTRVATTIHQRR